MLFWNGLCLFKTNYELLHSSKIILSQCIKLENWAIVSGVNIKELH
uniref:Uncharacterized protein n=1 Tax=Rhizophora mucronata TaxID=61149 RepID=A0A2P2NA83_RHIMU